MAITVLISLCWWAEQGLNVTQSWDTSLSLFLDLGLSIQTRSFLLSPLCQIQSVRSACSIAFFLVLHVLGEMSKLFWWCLCVRSIGSGQLPRPCCMAIWLCVGSSESGKTRTWPLWRNFWNLGFGFYKAPIACAPVWSCNGCFKYERMAELNAFAVILSCIHWFLATGGQRNISWQTADTPACHKVVIADIVANSYLFTCPADRE